MLCSEPTEGARQARRSDLALNRVGTLSFLPSPGATSHPETPTRTLGWGSERPAVGSILPAAAGSRHPPPPAGLSLQQSLVPPGPVDSGCAQASRGPPWDPRKGVRWESVEAPLQSLTRARVFATQEPRAGGPEVWGAQSIPRSGAQGGCS